MIEYKHFHMAVQYLRKLWKQIHESGVYQEQENLPVIVDQKFVKYKN